jgi:hypothetical protein
MRLVIGNAFSTNMLPGGSIIEFIPLTIDRVKEIMNSATEIMSIIGHPATAQLFTQLLQREIKVNRINYMMSKDDTLIIGSVATRLEEGKVLTLEELSKVKISWWLAKMKTSPNL